MCCQVELLAEHLKQLALFCTDLTVRTRASVGLEHLALCHPGVVGDMMPSLLQLLHVGQYANNAAQHWLYVRDYSVPHMINSYTKQSKDITNTELP